uniref:Gustatory receptor n=1 Tax=Lutzomyia longipalpis TaxID=7200 RepID=A0A7G3AEA5_LUTLO
MDFLAFSGSFFKQFRIFGVHPINRIIGGGGKNTPESFRDVARDKWSTVLVVILLTIYWFGIVMSFFMDHKGNDKISAISNIIQLILNAVALTTILTNGLLKFRTFDNILQEFALIDENLRGVGRAIKYHRSLILSRSILLTFIGYLILSIVFDCYVTVIRYEMTPIWYWIVATLPSVVYSMCLLQAMFIITWISTRCHLVNSILLCGSHHQNLHHHERNLPTLTHCGCLHGTTIPHHYHSYFCRHLHPGLLHLRHSNYNGDCSRHFGISIWSLLVSLNIVLMNVFLVISLTTICERVNSETVEILQNFSDLQINKEVPAELSIWLHPMISHMRFTAFGFFSIDYTMLCGFMTAIITYLVIFIQFYSLDPIHGDVNVLRANVKPPMPTKVF